MAHLDTPAYRELEAENAIAHIRACTLARVMALEGRLERCRTKTLARVMALEEADAREEGRAAAAYLAACCEAEHLHRRVTDLLLTQGGRAAFCGYERGP